MLGGKTQQGSLVSTSQNMDSRKPSVFAGAQDPDIWNRPSSQGIRSQWEDVHSINTAPLKDSSNRQLHRVATTNFFLDLSDSSNSTQVPAQDLSTTSQARDDLKLSSTAQHKESEVPTLATNFTSDTRVSNTTAQTAGTTDTAATAQLQDTRTAILRQLRLLFIYPVVYVLMWVFPFVSHCLQYSDYFAAHPPFWLNIVATCSLALQAGADCAVFSWREKPWRRVRRNGGREKVAKEGLRKMSVMLGHGLNFAGGTGNTMAGAGAGGGMGGGESPLEFGRGERVERRRDSHWWEEEGKKRKDSVWLGTDALTQIVSRQEQEEREEEEEEEEEGEEKGDAS